MKLNKNQRKRWQENDMKAKQIKYHFLQVGYAKLSLHDSSTENLSS